jgi:hypothetical protein
MRVRIIAAMMYLCAGYAVAGASTLDVTIQMSGAGQYIPLGNSLEGFELTGTAVIPEMGFTGSFSGTGQVPAPVNASEVLSGSIAFTSGTGILRGEIVLPAWVLEPSLGREPAFLGAIDVRSGSGALAGYFGSITLSLDSLFPNGPTASRFTLSGSGALDPIPEPGSAVLLGAMLVAMAAGRWIIRRRLVG